MRTAALCASLVRCLRQFCSSKARGRGCSNLHGSHHMPQPTPSATGTPPSSATFFAILSMRAPSSPPAPTVQRDGLTRLASLGPPSFFGPRFWPACVALRIGDDGLLARGEAAAGDGFVRQLDRPCDCERLGSGPAAGARYLISYGARARCCV